MNCKPFLFLICALIGLHCAHGETVFAPTHDAYTQNGNNYNNGELRVENSGRHRITYLQFDLSTLVGAPSGATLFLTGGSDRSSGDMTIRVFAAASTEWDEFEIDGETAPERGDEISVFEGNIEIGQVVEFDVGSLITGPGIYTLIVENDDSPLDVSFVSKDGAFEEEHPRLVVSDSGSDDDEDGMPDSWEDENGLDAEVNDAASDLDEDGLSNLGEFESGTDPNKPDSDGDTLLDGVETKTGIWVSAQDTGTNPVLIDSDGDGISDQAETNSGSFVDENDTGTNPNLVDSDADTMPDDYELANGLNPTTNDGDGDIDEDGATNLKEFELGTDQTKKDTDGDTLLDGVETKTGTWVSAEDTGTNPLTNDSDGDGLTDPVETNSGIFVSAANPGTNPNLADTDEDGFADGIEISQGANPVNAASKPSAAFVTVGRTDLVDEDGEIIDDGGADGWSGLTILETEIPPSDDGQTEGSVLSWNYITDTDRDASVEAMEYHVTPILVSYDPDEDVYSVAAVGETHKPAEGGAQLGIPFNATAGSAEFDVSGEITYHIGVLQQREGVDNAAGGIIPFAGAGGSGMFQMDTPGPDHEPAIGDPVERGHESGEGGRNYSFNFDIIYGKGPDKSLRFTEIVTNSESTKITWVSRADATYAVESSSDPNLFDWSELTDGFESQGELTTFTDPRDPDVRDLYYRVREE